MEVKLIVVRTADIKKLADFYALLGLCFEYHKHGSSLYHYSANLGKTVLEIYPFSKQQTEADKNLRLGFDVENFDEKIEVLKQAGVIFSSEPMQTEYGFMAVITDSDGRKIEIYENNEIPF